MGVVEVPFPLKILASLEIHLVSIEEDFSDRGGCSRCSEYSLA